MTAVALSVLLAVPVKLLWNWLVPDIFDLARVSYAQAWGLTLMLRLMFSTTQYVEKKVQTPSAEPRENKYNNILNY